MKKEQLIQGKLYKFNRNVEGDELGCREYVKFAVYFRLFDIHEENSYDKCHANGFYLDKDKKLIGSEIIRHNEEDILSKDELGDFIMDADFSELSEINTKFRKVFQKLNKL